MVDRYTKVVLTVIAIALSGLAIKEMGLPGIGWLESCGPTREGTTKAPGTRGNSRDSAPVVVNRNYPLATARAGAAPPPDPVENPLE